MIRLLVLKYRMFNNWDLKTNGEELFFNSIKDKIYTVFDVGCRSDSEFTNFDGEVHYFDPNHEFISALSSQPNKNKVSYFNSFGLGDETKDTYYYPKYQSFYDRTISCGESNTNDKVLLHIKNAKEYILEKNIKSIDFLKIDTEGYEFNVLKGFEEYLEIVNILQFEYGGTFLDSNVKLIDVIEYLTQNGFHRFSYLTNSGTKLIEDFTDHYTYCNIVCIHKRISLF